jgi:hypothetical protein
MFRDAVATPKHILHASTQVEQRSPTQDAAVRSLWCVQLWHYRRWKAPSVATVGISSLSGPGFVLGAVALEKANKISTRG